MSIKKYVIINFGLLAILLGLIIINANSYIRNEKTLNDITENNRAECLNNTDVNKIEFCDTVLNSNSYNGDFYYMFQEVYKMPLINFSIPFVIALVILSTLYFSKIFNTNMIKNYLTRDTYKHVMIKNILISYIPALILPITALVAFIICYCHYGSFDLLLSDSIAWSSIVTSKPILFIVLYIINLLVHGLLFINISILGSRKNHSFVMSTIISFIIVIGVELFFEVIINIFVLGMLFKNNSYGILFNIINFFSYHEMKFIFDPILIPIISLILSFIIIYISYKDKEKVLMSCEADEELNENRG